MPDHDRFLWVYFQLAQISQQKKQFIPRDKFLIMTAVEACKAGYLEIADQCRAIIIKHNPNHLLKIHSGFAEAMRDDDFVHFANILEKQFCNREQAEHLLYQSGELTNIEYAQPADTKLAITILEQLDDNNWEITQ